MQYRRAITCVLSEAFMVECSQSTIKPTGLGSSMNQVQVEQKSYQMPPQEGFTVAHFLTVADIERSL